MNTTLRLARAPLLLALLALLCGCGVLAPTSSEGYADLDSLSWRHTDTTMNLSLGPTVMRLAASAVQDDEEVRALLRSLEGVRVRIYRIDGDAQYVAADLNTMGQHLAQQGWEYAVQVRDSETATHVLSKSTCGEIAGLTVLTSDAREAVVVNVMGRLRPELLARTMQALQLPSAAIEPAQQTTTTEL